MSQSTHHQREKIDPQVLWRIIRYMFAYKWRFIIVFILIILGNIDAIANSIYLQILIDRYITPLMSQNNPDFSGLFFSIIIMAVIYGLGVLVSFLSEYLMIALVQGVLKNIRDQMFAKMQNLPIGYFDTHKFGDVMSLYTNDTDALEQMIGRTIPNAIASVTMIIMVLITMFYSNFFLSIIVLLVTALMFVVTGKIIGLSGRFFIQQQENLGQTNAYIEEMINGQKVIKVFSHEPATLREFAKLNDKLAVSNQKANATANVLMPVMISFDNLRYALIGIIGGLMAISGVGGVTLGLIAGFIQLNRNLSRHINMVSQQLNFIAIAAAGAKRIFRLMDEQPEVDHGHITLVNVSKKGNVLTQVKKRTGHWAWRIPQKDGSVQLIELQGDIRFQHVYFAYEKGKDVLHDITFFAEPGQRIAFVGATGAGKTTITNLLNRFYDIDRGEILYDGLNIKDIKKADLRRSLGVVLQDTNLFTGTVRQNIAYGKLTADFPAIKAAARTANANTFINTLPQGYDTQIEGDGSDLSQGQRQLLSIARAAVNDPPAMILDEATSSIDTRTEKIIQQGMDNLMHGRTTLVIAHRLSTIRTSRAIMVMEHGRIIESGSHEKLMQLHGVYHQLYTGAIELD